MRKRQTLALAGVLLVVGALVSASPSVARSSRMPVDFWEVSCVVDPGMDLISDGVLHGRGRVTKAVFYAYDSVASEAVIVGSGTVVGHADLELPAGNGGLFGVFTMIYLPASSLGTFDGRWHGELSGWVAFLGQAIGGGTGPMRRAKVRLQIRSDPVPAWLEDELDLNPPPCGRANASITHDVGFIHGRHGG